MKIALLLFLFPAILNGQGKKEVTIPDIPEKDGLPFYEKVVQLDTSVRKEDLFINARLFFVKAFKSSKDVIQMEDKDLGKIIGKGIFTFSYGTYFDVGNHSETIDFLIDITVKEKGKYRIQISDFKHVYKDVKTPIDVTFGYVGNGLSNKYASYNEMMEKAKAGKKWAISAVYNFNHEVESLIKQAEKDISKAKPDDF